MRMNVATVFAGPIQIFVAIAIVLGVFTVLRGEDSLPPLVERLKTEEAFRSNPYQDSLGHETIGYGTKLPITEAEGAWLLGTRLADTHARLVKAWAPYGGLNHARQGALLDLAYRGGRRWPVGASTTCWRPLSGAIGRPRARRRLTACGRRKCRAARSRLRRF